MKTTRSTSLFAAAPLLLAFALQAQITTPVQQPKPDAEAGELTPEERIAKLEAEAAKLAAEKQRLQEIEQEGGLPTRIKQVLVSRDLSVKTIEDKNKPAQSIKPAQPAQPEAIKARLFTDAERADLGSDVIMTVEGVPATQAEFDSALAYLNAYPQQREPEMLKQQVILELIRLKAPQAVFADSAAAAKANIEKTQAKLAAGEDFAELAKTRSQCPSNVKGGDLDYFGRVGMDFWFTKAAFAMDVDEVSQIVPTSFGYHLIKVTGKEQGDTADRDRVRASHILQLYTEDQRMLGEVNRRVIQGQLQLAFANEDLLALAPAVYR